MAVCERLKRLLTHSGAVDHELAHVCMFRGRFIAPTLARSDADFYVVMNPVVVTEDLQPHALASALEGARTCGNPPVRTPDRNERRPSVVAAAAGMPG